MTENETARAQGALPDGSARPRRRWAWAVAALVAVILLLPSVAALALWLRLGAGPLALPPPIASRIEARLDQAMAANRLSLGRVEILRPSAPGLLELRLQDIALTDPDGAVRAAFPQIRVALPLAALRQGRVEPQQVWIEGAGLRLARDAAGRIDLDLLADGAGGDLGLADSLARIDLMFAAPVFAQLGGVEGAGLELVLEDAVTGQTLRVADARLALTRTAGALRLSVGGALEGSRAGRIDIAMTRSAATAETDLEFAFEDLAARDVATIGPMLAWVDLMRAPISGSLGGVLRDDGVLGDQSLALRIGPGVFRPGQGAAITEFDAVEARLRYDAARGRIVFDSFDLRAPDLSFSGQGHADLSPDGDRYIAQMRLSDIMLRHPEFWPEPLRLADAMVDFRLSLAPFFQLDIGQAVIRTEDLALSARGRVGFAPEGPEVALDLSLPEITPDAVLSYWPVALLSQTRGWLADNLGAGRISGAHLALRQVPGGAMTHDLGFGFDGAEIRVLPAMAPIAAAAGYLSMTGPRLALRLDRGQISAPGGGRVLLDGSQMLVEDTRVLGPEAQIDLAVTGGLADILALVEAPPLSVLAQGAMTAARLGDGAAELRLALSTRLMAQEGLDGTAFDVTGHVTDYLAPDLIPGRRLSAERLDLALTPDAIRIWGRARLDDVAFDGEWQRPLGEDAPRASRLEGRLALDPGVLAGFGVALPEGWMAGQTAADLQMRFPDGAAPELRLSSDLAGAGLSLPPFGWRQGPDATGALEAVITLGPVPTVTGLSLNVDGLSLSGRVDVAANGRFDRLIADRFRLGRWLDVTGAVIGRGPGRSPVIEITGGTLDLRGAPQVGMSRHAANDGTITATLDRLQVTEGIAISPLLADLTVQGGLSGQFRGRVNGEAPVVGTLINTNTGPAVRLRAEDGGQVLRSAGIFRSAYGGEMELILQAAGQQGVYDGSLRMLNPRLRDAPVMAEMLNVVSVVGLIDQLGGEGINLGEVDARFRITPTQVILSDGVAFGPALGLSLSGSYDLAGRQLEMEGVLSPLNAVNGLIGAIFSARREGLFGFAYRLTGPSSAPQVTLNPLSILTPGVFREVFRRPPPTDGPP